MKVRDDIVLFEGRISNNNLLKSMVGNVYFLRDGDEVILFDSSCGREIAKRIEAYIRNLRGIGTPWRRALLIAGHSHADHANNFYLSDMMGIENTHIYVHEKGFKNGILNNDPVTFIRNMVEDSKKYYNFYLTPSIPAILVGYPMTMLHKISQTLAAKVFSKLGALAWPSPVNGSIKSKLGALAWPSPVNGSIKPELLRHEDMQDLDFGVIKVKGWRLGNKVLLPTPGHSPCSVSLYWPDRKAIFAGDADWHGNPLFLSSSMKDCISSLEMMKKLTQAGRLELFLPGHGEVIEGVENILKHLDSCIQRLESMRNEVLSACRSHGEKDVSKLTKILMNESPSLRELSESQFPKSMVLVHNIVTICLKEAGIID